MACNRACYLLSQVSVYAPPEFPVGTHGEKHFRPPGMYSLLAWKSLKSYTFEEMEGGVITPYILTLIGLFPNAGPFRLIKNTYEFKHQILLQGTLKVY